jgi:hypothetical protein
MSFSSYIAFQNNEAKNNNAILGNIVLPSNPANNIAVDTAVPFVTFPNLPAGTYLISTPFSVYITSTDTAKYLTSLNLTYKVGPSLILVNVVEIVFTTADTVTGSVGINNYTYNSTFLYNSSGGELNLNISGVTDNGTGGTVSLSSPFGGIPTAILLS